MSSQLKRTIESKISHTSRGPQISNSKSRSDNSVNKKNFSQSLINIELRDKFIRQATKYQPLRKNQASSIIRGKGSSENMRKSSKDSKKNKTQKIKHNSQETKKSQERKKQNTEIKQKGKNKGQAYQREISGESKLKSEKLLKKQKTVKQKGKNEEIKLKKQNKYPPQIQPEILKILKKIRIDKKQPEIIKQQENKPLMVPQKRGLVENAPPAAYRLPNVAESQLKLQIDPVNEAVPQSRILSAINSHRSGYSSQQRIPVKPSSVLSSSQDRKNGNTQSIHISQTAALDYSQVQQIEQIKRRSPKKQINTFKNQQENKKDDPQFLQNWLDSLQQNNFSLKDQLIQSEKQLIISSKQQSQSNPIDNTQDKKLQSQVHSISNADIISSSQLSSIKESKKNSFQKKVNPLSFSKQKVDLKVIRQTENLSFNRNRNESKTTQNDNFNQEYLKLHRMLSQQSNEKYLNIFSSRNQLEDQLGVSLQTYQRPETEPTKKSLNSNIETHDQNLRISEKDLFLDQNLGAEISENISLVQQNQLQNLEGLKTLISQLNEPEENNSQNSQQIFDEQSPLINSSEQFQKIISEKDQFSLVQTISSKDEINEISQAQIFLKYLDEKWKEKKQENNSSQVDNSRNSIQSVKLSKQKSSESSLNLEDIQLQELNDENCNILQQNLDQYLDQTIQEEHLSPARETEQEKLEDKIQDGGDEEISPVAFVQAIQEMNLKSALTTLSLEEHEDSGESQILNLDDKLQSTELKQVSIAEQEEIENNQNQDNLNGALSDDFASGGYQHQQDMKYLRKFRKRQQLIKQANTAAIILKQTNDQHDSFVENAPDILINPSIPIEIDIQENSSGGNNSSIFNAGKVKSNASSLTLGVGSQKHHHEQVLSGDAGISNSQRSLIVMHDEVEDEDANESLQSSDQKEQNDLQSLHSEQINIKHEEVSHDQSKQNLHKIQEDNETTCLPSVETQASISSQQEPIINQKSIEKSPKSFGKSDCMPPPQVPTPSVTHLTLQQFSGDITAEQVSTYLHSSINKTELKHQIKQVVEMKQRQNIEYDLIRSDDYVNELLQYLLQFEIIAQEESAEQLLMEISGGINYLKIFLTNLTTPVKRDFIKELNRLQTQDLGSYAHFESCFDPLKFPILAIDMYLDVEKQRQFTYQIQRRDSLSHNSQEGKEKKNYDSRNSAFSSIQNLSLNASVSQESMHILNKAIFDAMNESLSKFRPYGMIGEPLPWSNKYRRLQTDVDINSVDTERLFQMVKQEVYRWMSAQQGALYLSRHSIFQYIDLTVPTMPEIIEKVKQIENNQVQADETKQQDIEKPNEDLSPILKQSKKELETLQEVQLQKFKEQIIQEATQEIRQSKLLGLLHQQIVEDEHQWTNYEYEETQIRIDLSELIFETLMEETVDILQKLN